jgi:hypothetical protein
MKYDWKLALKRLLGGVVAGVVAALGIGVADPKQLVAAGLAGAASAFGIDLHAFDKAHNQNALTRIALQNAGVDSKVVDKATVNPLPKVNPPGNVG